MVRPEATRPKVRQESCMSGCETLPQVAPSPRASTLYGSTPFIAKPHRISGDANSGVPSTKHEPLVADGCLLVASLIRTFQSFARPLNLSTWAVPGSVSISTGPEAQASSSRNRTGTLRTQSEHRVATNPWTGPPTSVHRTNWARRLASSGSLSISDSACRHASGIRVSGIRRRRQQARLPCRSAPRPVETPSLSIARQVRAARPLTCPSQPQLRGAHPSDDNSVSP